MKKNAFVKKIAAVFIAAALLLTAAACSSAGGGLSADPGDYMSMPGSADEFRTVEERGFTSAADEPDSYFSLDANAAAYSILRRAINERRQLSPDQIRTEELVNYFTYDYPAPAAYEVMTLSGALMPTPWNSETHLMTIGLKTEAVEMSAAPNNLVLLVDISGSMASSDRLGLLKEAFVLLTRQMTASDRLTLVTYASGVKVLADGANGSQRAALDDALDSLAAGGSTAGARGIQTAYEYAAKHFIAGGNNRVILATDGDFNVGISSQDGLKAFISGKRDTGIYLSVLGVGYGNLKDNKMETLAASGNGNYYYLDSVSEAKKVLVEEAGGTLRTVAKDAKAMVSFIPDAVKEYRLIGYDNKRLGQEEWDDEAADAGELGAGKTVTAVYEVRLHGGVTSGGVADVSIRYKDPGTDAPAEKSLSLTAADISKPTGDRKFISAVVEAALIFRNSEYKADASLDNAIARLEAIPNLSEDAYKAEFLELLRIYKGYN
ncbi:MAG: von Willebrand factor type A domain-containing protein [Clostridiales bacterium]|jgi:Ca-activated chloride channel family protein|nr:von Willebrand factor type A domain-containing protein [Clostridiales bacterium]